MTRLTIISFSCGFDSAIMLNVEMWKCCQFQCCQFQFQPPIFFFVVITLAERMRDSSLDSLSKSASFVFST